MKRMLILILSCLMVTAAITPVYAEWTQLQTQANQIANIARAMGLPETHAIISESSKIWWQEETEKQNAAAERAEFEASLQGFLNDHHADKDVLTRWYREKHGEETVGRTLPQGYCYYYGNGRHNLFRTGNSGKGSYNFGLENPYE